MFSINSDSSALSWKNNNKVSEVKNWNNDWNYKLILAVLIENIFIYHIFIRACKQKNIGQNMTRSFERLIQQIVKHPSDFVVNIHSTTRPDAIPAGWDLCTTKTIHPSCSSWTADLLLRQRCCWLNDSKWVTCQKSAAWGWSKIPSVRNSMKTMDVDLSVAYLLDPQIHGKRW